MFPFPYTTLFVVHVFSKIVVSPAFINPPKGGLEDDSTHFTMCSFQDLVCYYIIAPY